MRTDIKAKTISMKHFEDAMKKVRPSVTKEIEKSYQDIQEGFRSAHAKQMGEDKPNYFG